MNPEEFNLLLQHCPEHLKGPVLIAFYLPMRQAEILKLTWDQIDFKSEFIRLSGKQTKNKTGRAIPMHPRILKYLSQIPRPIHGGYVFKKRWFDRKGYNKAVEKAGLGDFNFHDLRHAQSTILDLLGTITF